MNRNDYLFEKYMPCLNTIRATGLIMMRVISLKHTGLCSCPSFDLIGDGSGIWYLSTFAYDSALSKFIALF